MYVDPNTLLYLGFYQFYGNLSLIAFKAVSEIRLHTLISYLLKFPFLLSFLPYWIILRYVQDSKCPIYFSSEYKFSILIIFNLLS